MTGPEFSEKLQALNQMERFLPEGHIVSEDQKARINLLLKLEERTFTLRMPYIVWRFMQGPAADKTQDLEFIEEAVIDAITGSGKKPGNLAFLFAMLAFGGEAEMQGILAALKDVHTSRSEE